MHNEKGSGKGYYVNSSSTAQSEKPMMKDSVYAYYSMTQKYFEDASHKPAFSLKNYDYSKSNNYINKEYLRHRENYGVPQGTSKSALSQEGNEEGRISLSTKSIKSNNSNNNPVSYEETLSNKTPVSYDGSQGNNPQTEGQNMKLKIPNEAYRKKEDKKKKKIDKQELMNYIINKIMEEKDDEKEGASSSQKKLLLALSQVVNSKEDQIEVPNIQTSHHSHKGNKERNDNKKEDFKGEKKKMKPQIPFPEKEIPVQIDYDKINKLEQEKNNKNSSGSDEVDDKNSQNASCNTDTPNKCSDLEYGSGSMNPYTSSGNSKKSSDAKYMDAYLANQMRQMNSPTDTFTSNMSYNSSLSKGQSSSREGNLASVSEINNYLPQAGTYINQYMNTGMQFQPPQGMEYMSTYAQMDSASAYYPPPYYPDYRMNTMPNPGYNMMPKMPMMYNQNNRKTRDANVHEGDWICAICGNWNFSYREVCKRCKNYKQVDERQMEHELAKIKKKVNPYTPHTKNKYSKMPQTNFQGYMNPNIDQKNK